MKVSHPRRSYVKKKNHLKNTDCYIIKKNAH